MLIRLPALRLSWVFWSEWWKWNEIFSISWAAAENDCAGDGDPVPRHLGRVLQGPHRGDQDIRRVSSLQQEERTLTLISSYNSCARTGSVRILISISYPIIDLSSNIGFSLKGFKIQKKLYYLFGQNFILNFFVVNDFSRILIYVSMNLHPWIFLKPLFIGLK